MPRNNSRFRNKKIHPTAIIHPEARLEKNVEVGPYTVIGENVEIGAGSKVGSNVQIEGWTRIGTNNEIYNNCSIGLPPQHHDYAGEKTYLFIGDNNCIREFVTVHRGTVEGGETRIGSNNVLKPYSHVAHDCLINNGITLGSTVNLAGHVIIENNAYISELSGVHQFVRIGQLAFIKAHSKVVKDLPPYICVGGHPAQVEGVNIMGLRIHGISKELRSEITRAFEILYKESLNMADAIEKMDQVLKTSEEIEHLISFLKNSTRGICR